MRAAAFVLTVSFAFSTLSAFAVPKVEATLSLDQTSVLPGIPASMRLSLRNLAAEPLTARDWFRLLVTPVDGQEFVAQIDDIDYVQVTSTELVPSLTIPANGTLTVAFPLTPHLESITWFADRRLSQPGRYRLRIELADPSTPAYSPEYHTLTTNEVTLEVLQPSGTDASVWALMQQKTGGHGFGLRDWMFHGVDIANAIYSQYGSSGYLPYVAYWVPTPIGAYATRLGHVERALATGVQGPVREMLLLAKAHIGVAWAGNAFSRRDIDTAASASTLARTAIEALLAESTSPYMIVQANSLSREALTRERWVARDAWLASLDHPPGTAKPVVPRVQCVKETGNRLEATFGYSNPNSFTVALPIGPRNKFSPMPEDRHQPTSFLPGLQERVISVVVDGKKNDPSRRIDWTLDGVTVSAPVDGVPKCKNN